MMMHEPHDNDTDKQPSNSCCDSFQAELRRPVFSPMEVLARQQWQLHGPNTFAPQGTKPLLVKTICMGWSLSTLLVGLFVYAPPPFMAFFFAFLTNWTLSLSVLYLVLSWGLTLRATLDPHVDQLSLPVGMRASAAGTDTQEQERAPDLCWVHKLSWALFSVAAPAQIVCIIGFWTNPQFWGLGWGYHYHMIMSHGGVMVLLLVDGFWVNGIPLRARQFGFLFLFMVAYLIWTAIQAYYEIGTKLYPGILEWRENPVLTGGYTLLYLFVLTPLCFLIIYGMSRFGYRNGGAGRSNLIQVPNINVSPQQTSSSVPVGSTDYDYASLEKKMLEGGMDPKLLEGFLLSLPMLPVTPRVETSASDVETANSSSQKDNDSDSGSIVYMV